VSFSDIARDGRVLREVEYASREYSVEVIGYGEWSSPWANVNYTRLRQGQVGAGERLVRAGLLIGGAVITPLWGLVYRVPPSHRHALKVLTQGRHDLIHANDLAALPVAVAAARRTGGKVLFDAHEYSPGQTTSWGRLGMLRKAQTRSVFRRFSKVADAIVTVSPGIADLIQKELGIEASVIMNIPSYKPIGFRPVDPSRIRLVHHGAAIRRRRLESIVELMGHLDDRFALVLILAESPEDPIYLHEIKALARVIAPDRIEFQPAVLPGEIVPVISRFDIGVYLLPGSPINQKLALPNKLFEFITAGLAVAIGPSPEMARITEEYDVGIVAKGFRSEDLADAILGLSPGRIDEMKRNSLVAARTLNADVEMGKLMTLYGGLLGAPRHPTQAFG